MKNLTLPILALGVLAAFNVQAQVNFSAVVSSGYLQNFDGLGSASAAWADNTTLGGWYAASSVSGAVTPFSAYTTSAGGSSTSSTLFALGTSGSSERAIGGAASTTTTHLFGLRLANDTGSAIDNLAVTYDGEQWRRDLTAVSTISVSYQVFNPGAGSLSVASGWTSVPALTFSSPVTGAAVGSGSQDGNTVGAIRGITAALSALNVPNGSELWLKWSTTKLNGNNLPQGIDNVSLVVPEPTSAALLGIGLLMVALRKAAK